MNIVLICGIFIYVCRDEAAEEAKSLNIGLIGFGSMGRTHAYAVQNLKYFYRDLPFDARISGICCAHRENAAAAAKAFSLGKVYERDIDMINDPDIDIIDICTPNIYHYETLKAAIAAGKHIYCEKPLCTAADEAFEIASLAKKKGIVGAVVFNTRFLLPVMRAAELVRAGRIGDVLSFSSKFFHSSVADPNHPAGWKQDRDICGGGVLFDLGSHAIDLVRMLCGEFESVSGLSQIAYPERIGTDGKMWRTNADEAFYITAKLRCGACGTVSVGKIMQGTNDDHSFEIYGSRGSIKFDLMGPNFLYFYDAEASESERGFTRIECCGRYPEPSGIFPGKKAPVGWLRGHVGSMYSFLDCVYRNAEPSPSFEDAAAVQLIMEKAYKSDRCGGVRTEICQRETKL